MTSRTASGTPTRERSGVSSCSRISRCAGGRCAMCPRRMPSLGQAGRRPPREPRMAEGARPSARPRSISMIHGERQAPQAASYRASVVLPSGSTMTRVFSSFLAVISGDRLIQPVGDESPDGVMTVTRVEMGMLRVPGPLEHSLAHCRVSHAGGREDLPVHPVLQLPRRKNIGLCLPRRASLQGLGDKPVCLFLQLVAHAVTQPHPLALGNYLSHVTLPRNVMDPPRPRNCCAGSW